MGGESTVLGVVIAVVGVIGSVLVARVARIDRKAELNRVLPTW